LLEDKFRKTKNAVSRSWRADETYVRAKGKWMYLYRAIDKYGNTIDFFLDTTKPLKVILWSQLMQLFNFSYFLPPKFT
jgi:transposase-like protein